MLGITWKDPHGNDLIINPTTNLVVSLELLLSKILSKMLKNLLVVLGKVIVTVSVLVPANYCTSNTKLERQLQLINADFNISDTELVKESEKNNSLTTINGIWFWTPSDENTTQVIGRELDIHNNQDVSTDVKGSFVTETNLIESSNSHESAVAEFGVKPTEPPYEEINYEGFPPKLNNFSQIKKKIIMPRNNCQTEVGVHEHLDGKLTIIFGRLQNNSYGTCCLTLSGHKKSMLGIVISNVHLYRNNNQGEILKVLIGNHYPAFVIKQYYGSKDYEPVLLTETHKVYLVLNYKVEYVAPSQDCSYFDLEVFTYENYENNVHHLHDHKDKYNYTYAREGNQSLDINSSKKKNYFPFSA